MRTLLQTDIRKNESLSFDIGYHNQRPEQPPNTVPTQNVHWSIPDVRGPLPCLTEPIFKQNPSPNSNIFHKWNRKNYCGK